MTDTDACEHDRVRCEVIGDDKPGAFFKFKGTQFDFCVKCDRVVELILPIQRVSP